ncbi:MAG: 23S rRNA (pseudouridine(1915)-N(3))-methyltransferase RlmH [Methanocellales archaeon]
MGKKIMWRIRLLWPGRTREPFLREGIERYLKLLHPYAKVEILEVKEGRGRGMAAVDFESENLLRAVKGDFILLDSKGINIASEEFAKLLQSTPTIEFVVGGAFGVNEAVRKRAKMILSLSKMTFTHEMTRLILLEQIYRAMTIIHRRGYHH